LIPAVVLAVVLVTVIIAAFVADEPLRRYVEGEANSALPGYRVTVGGLDLHPLTLSVDLHDIVVRQDIHPDPALLSIPRVTAAAQFAPLFSGEIGAAVTVDAPAFAINQNHVNGFLRRGDKEVVKNQADAWQDKIRATVAFRGAFHVTNGHLTYDDEKGRLPPLQVEHIEVDVENMTNRPEENDEYPSRLRVRAQFPDDSRMELAGHANLLSIPVPRVDADLKIDRLHLKNLLPVAQRFNVQCREGALDLNGRLQYSKESTVVAIGDLRLEDAKIDYVHSAATKPKEVRRAKKVAETVKEAHQDPTVRVKVDHAKIARSEVGFVNEATDPDYRVFIADLDMDLDNLGNRLEE
jgi:hypothetical protein